MWLWTAQNAFLVESDPSTNKRWEDRHGVAFDKSHKRVGNIETFFNYDKLQRTGRMLRGLSVNVQSSSAVGRNVTLSNRMEYAKDHNDGATQSRNVTIRPPYTRGGATIKTGGKIFARPFMHPSKKVLKMPYVLVVRKIRAFGWTNGV